MQIIIVQSEIETAIRNYVLSQLNVKEGQRIDIDLKATRGESGATAIIDIVSENAPIPNRQPEVPANKPGPKPMQKIAAAAHISHAGSDQEAPAGNQGEETEPAPDAVPVDEQAAPADETQPLAQEEEAADEPAAQPARSLFAGLKKPVNQATS